MSLDTMTMATQSIQKNECDTNEIKEPHDHDVLCGRGGASFKHVGNYTFRYLVLLNKELYSTSKKREKKKVAERIIFAIRSQDPPGRFLGLNSKTGCYYEIEEKRALEKTSQALRDCQEKEIPLIESLGFKNLTMPPPSSIPTKLNKISPAGKIASNLMDSTKDSNAVFSAQQNSLNMQPSSQMTAPEPVKSFDVPNTQASSIVNSAEAFGKVHHNEYNYLKPPDMPQVAPPFTSTTIPEPDPIPRTVSPVHNHSEGQKNIDENVEENQNNNEDRDIKMPKMAEIRDMLQSSIQTFQLSDDELVEDYFDPKRSHRDSMMSENSSARNLMRCSILTESSFRQLADDLESDDIIVQDNVKKNVNSDDYNKNSEVLQEVIAPEIVRRRGNFEFGMKKMSHRSNSLLSVFSSMSVSDVGRTTSGHSRMSYLVDDFLDDLEEDSSIMDKDDESLRGL